MMNIRTMSRIIPIIFIVLLVSSCSGPGGCYFLQDRAAALDNKVPYWEDIIYFFPDYFGEWKIDRFVVSKKLMKANPPPRTFYDSDGSPIEWDKRFAPEKFAGYSVAVNYYKNYSPDTSQVPFSLKLYFSRPVIKSLRDEITGHEKGERQILNGFELTRGDPKISDRAVAFYNSELCIECVLHPTNQDDEFEKFKWFLERVDLFDLIDWIEEFDLAVKG
jgi:hypothetical protein